jgi:hypothetical protein
VRRLIPPDFNGFAIVITGFAKIAMVIGLGRALPQGIEYLGLAPCDPMGFGYHPTSSLYLKTSFMRLNNE